MKKDGEVKAGSSRCDRCGEPATRVVGAKAACNKHADILVGREKDRIEELVPKHSVLTTG